MKALSLIAAILGAFLIFIGISTKKASGALSNAVIIGGALIILFIIIVWAVMKIKEKREKQGENDFDDPGF